MGSSAQGSKKQVAVAVIIVQKEGYQLQRMSNPPAVRSHRQRLTGFTGWARKGAGQGGWVTEA